MPMMLMAKCEVGAPQLDLMPAVEHFNAQVFILMSRFYEFNFHFLAQFENFLFFHLRN